MLHISFWISWKNLVLDDSNTFYVMSFSILINCLVDNFWIS